MQSYSRALLRRMALCLALAAAPAMAKERTMNPPSADAPRCCAVVELRQYTLHEGRRDALVALFDREFVESQEATGMTVIGQFRDLDAPDRFVWLRGFADMDVRATALAAFYGGPVWRAHRDAANATMIDSDDVLLLRPTAADAGFAHDDAPRPPRDATQPRGGVLVATILHAGREDAAAFDAAFVARFDREVAPLLAQAGAPVRARFVTERSANTFPRLPVREDANVFVWFACVADAAAWTSHQAALAALPEWQAVSAWIAARSLRQEILRLQPTARSRLHCGDA